MSDETRPQQIKIHDNREITVEGTVEDVDPRSDWQIQKEAKKSAREMKKLRKGLSKYKKR